MRKTQWGVIGPGAIAHNFADGLAGTDTGQLVAVASRDAARRQRFGDRYGIAAEQRHTDYAALVADPAVDAVYIATPHPFHAELSLLAIRGGKAVVVEKPAGLSTGEVVTVTDAARRAGVFFMEAFMYRCHPQIARMIELIDEGAIGEVRHIRATFGFEARFDPKSRLFDRALAGGGILDVGGYPVSFARLAAGVAIGQPFDNPVSVKGVGNVGKSGVDEVAYGVLGFASGITAEIACAVTRNMDNICSVIGTKGRIDLPNPWIPGRNAGPSDATIHVAKDGTERTETLRHPEHLFTFEADVASRAIAEGRTSAPSPAMTPADSVGNAETLDRWRVEVGYQTIADLPATNRPLRGTLPRGQPQIPSLTLPGSGRTVSRLVMGCDNKGDLASGAIVWDAFVEAGGTTFDTAFVYGGGLHETVLGQWIAARKLADAITVIVKGAHSPYCLPDTIAPQLEMSLARLGLPRAPIYIMHRDNPDVPVGEFVDALNHLADAGRIGEFGGSNWTIERFDQANDYAARHGLRPLTILNDNLSLAVMERPVWPGCLSVNTPVSLAWLRRTGTTHLSWSSQARGYFLPEAERGKLPPDTSPEACFGSAENSERRNRAELLARARGVSAHNIATAWVIGQSFPSLALIGPRTVDEIVTTLPGLTLTLTHDEVLWLNLERDVP